MPTYFISASYATGTGNRGAWSGEIEAPNDSAAMQAARRRIGKRAAGKVDMGCILQPMRLRVVEG